MYFETALNLVWLLLGLVALASTIRVRLRPSPEPKRAPAWLHIVGVGLIVAALFPYISATDDVVRIEHFNAQHNHAQHNRRHPGKAGHNDDLVRLYETMDTPLVGQAPEVVVQFYFVALTFTPVLHAIDRIAPREAGRSPPLVAV